MGALGLRQAGAVAARGNLEKKILRLLFLSNRITVPSSVCAPAPTVVEPHNIHQRKDC